MADHLEADDVLARSVAAMPAPLGELYYEFFKQIAWIHFKWKDFRRLFGSDPEIVDLLNCAAPAFFYSLQEMMWQDVILHMCRLTDPIKSAGKDTLTIRRLPGLIPDLAVRSKVERLANDAKKKTDFARDWRNRRFAHCELPPIQGKIAQPLAQASLKHVEEALAAIRTTINCVEEHYLGVAVSYAAPNEPLGGVSSLMEILRLGVETQDAERQKYLSAYLPPQPG